MSAPSNGCTLSHLAVLESGATPTRRKGRVGRVYERCCSKCWTRPPCNVVGRSTGRPSSLPTPVTVGRERAAGRRETVPSGPSSGLRGRRLPGVGVARW